MTNWTRDDARHTYNLPRWSGGYFDVGGDVDDAAGSGHLVARPAGPDGPAIDLRALADEVRAAGLKLPVLVRFTDILRDRVQRLTAAFQAAREELGYVGDYTAVYPIKVNQQRQVVETLLAAESEARSATGLGSGSVGLEAGSKPELLAVMALSHPGDTVICNGYKDREYVRLALIGERMGLQVHIVVEKLSELERVLAEAEAMGVRPRLGVRVRLATIGAGKWQNTGGEKSKFGLSASQVITAVERLEQAGCLECLQLLHFHLGSQIPNIRDIRQGLLEAGRYYAELQRMGVPVTTVDVGGGLGVDYEGSHSRSYCSMNYSLEEYAHNVVHALWTVCAEEGLPHPRIITESGRAMTAHHAVLITNVIDTERATDERPVTPVEEDAPLVLQRLEENLQRLEAGTDRRSPLEAWHDAEQGLAEAQQMYTHGVLPLARRAEAERLCYATVEAVRRRLQPGVRSQREALDELSDRLADKYFLNFSLFQSLPDVWAIDQVFPVVPLQRLDERPTRRGVIQDITCDSDGRIDHYVDGEGLEASLPLHPVEAREDYLIGLFMVGAYQEILGDMHNLFGDTDAINVELEPGGGHRLHLPRQGDTVASVLRTVHFDPEKLLAAFEATLSASTLDDTGRASCLEELRTGLTGYTYLGD